MGLKSPLDQPCHPFWFVTDVAHLEQTIFEGVDKAMHSEGGSGIPGSLDSGAGADIKHLADDVQLSQPVARQRNR